MKTKIIVGLSVALVTSSFSIFAENDNPAQAIARAALEQKLSELNNSDAQPPSSVTPVIAKADVQTAKTPAESSAPVAASPTKPQITPTMVPALVPTPAAITKVEAPATAKVEAAATPTLSSHPVVAHASTKLSTPTAKAKSGDKIVTTTGTVFENVEVEKKTSDGMYISYSIAGGGIAVSKVNYSELTPESLKQFASK